MTSALENPDGLSITPRRIPSLATQLVGPHVGLIEELLAVRPEADDVPLAVYAARLCRTSALGAIDVPQAVSGAALERPHALAACLGEALERYAAALPGPKAVRRSLMNELPGRAVTPDRFALFSPVQHQQAGFPFVRWATTLDLGWTQAWSLTRQEPVWVPATFVWQPYVPLIHEPPLAPCLTTGLACGATWTDAVVAALCEVLERDAVALAWLGGVQPKRIVAAGRAFAASTQTVMDLLTRGGFRWALFDLTTDTGVPVAAAIVEGHSPLGWIVSFGSAAAPDPEWALRKALVEASHCRMYVKSLLREQPLWRAGKKLEHVTSFADHARFYTVHPEQRESIDHWWSSRQQVDWRSFQPRGANANAATWLGGQVERLVALAYEVLAVDVTTPDIRDLGQSVARVLVPGLQPLHGHHGWPHLGGSRLAELTRVFGSHARQPKTFNRWPHPCA